MKHTKVMPAVLALLAGLQTQVPAFAEMGVSNDKITFGRSTNKTGSSPSAYTERGWGYEAYFKAVNDHGGVHGRKIEVIELDDGYEPQKAFENTKRFVEEMKVFGLYGYAGTPTMQAVIPYLKNTNVPFIALNAATLIRTPLVKNVFTVRAGYQDELNAMVAHAVDKSKKTKIGIFYQDDAYGKEGVNGLNRELPKRKLTTFAAASYRRNEKDIGPAFNSLFKAKPEVVIMFVQAKQAGEFLKRAKEANWSPLIYATSNQATGEMFKDAGSATDLAIFSQSLPEVDELQIPVVKNFNRDMKSMGKEVSGVSFEAYVGAIAIVEALKRAGKDLTRDKFIAAMESLGGFDFGGLKSHISVTDHQAMDLVYLTKYKNGKPYKVD